MIKQKIQLKNIGDQKFPQIIVGKEFAVYTINGSELIPAKTRHESLRSLTMTAPEFSYGKKRQEMAKKEVATTKDTVHIWVESVIYDPSQGKIGTFYIFDHATPKYVIFKFWKENK